MTSLKETGRDPDHREGEAAATTHGGLAETVHESAVSHDKPMERKAPEAPFALVGLAYLAVLAVIGLIIGIVLFALS